MTQKHFLLIYEAVDDYIEKRTPYRAAHLALLKALEAKGDLVLAGALMEPADGSVFLFLGETDEAARTFAEQDPYVQNGLITKWYVREWMTVVGAVATHPV